MGQSSSKYPPDEVAFVPHQIGGDPSKASHGQTRSFRHPMAALFHILFKSLALMIYLFGGIFGNDFKSTFVAVILLISMDFWVVKNVTGRLLAGLRWSNFIDDDGNSHWIFENKRKASDQDNQDDDDNQEAHAQSSDSTMFWFGLISAPTIWTFLVFVSIFKFNVQWLMLVTLAATLSISNLYGYIRCRLGTSDIKSSITQFVAKKVFLSYLTGGGGTGASSRPSA